MALCRLSASEAKVGPNRRGSPAWARCGGRERDVQDLVAHWDVADTLAREPALEWLRGVAAGGPRGRALPLEDAPAKVVKRRKRTKGPEQLRSYADCTQIWLLRRVGGLGYHHLLRRVRSD